MTLLTHVCHLLPVISQGSPPCLGYVNVLQSCEAVDCLVAAWSLAKGLGQKSRSQRSKQILSQFGQVRIVTPVWIHIWLTNDAQSSLENVPYYFSRSYVKFQGHTGKSERCDSYDRPSNISKIGFKSSIFRTVWPWNLMDGLEKQWGTFSIPHLALCIISKPSVNSNWVTVQKHQNLGQNRWFFFPCDL